MNDTCEPVGRASGHAVRGGVRDQLCRWGADALADDAELVVSELLANAVRHGRPPVRVALTMLGRPVRRRVVRIEVTDAGTAVDVARVRARWRHPSFRLGEIGRGLLLVDGLSTRWGDKPAPGGHTVWADLR
ncbi:ATP-binding protein [Streptomyces sp. E2N166]|uniref:ATP-binding protein n=1 Tax=Streptomyces sp. E2N166 TaxID=1851909 RepID=UPI000EF6B3FF|nr:ATP-binding protein [Streptomyces sp. E2N166]